MLLIRVRGRCKDAALACTVSPTSSPAPSCMTRGSRAPAGRPAAHSHPYHSQRNSQGAGSTGSRPLHDVRLPFLKRTPRAFPTPPIRDPS